MIKLRRSLYIGWPLLSLLVLPACGDDKKEDAGRCASADALVAEATYDSLWTNVFSGRCGSCHGASAAGTTIGPDMRTQADFYTNVVGKAVKDYPDWDQAQITMKDCLATPMINPGKASESLLIGTLDTLSLPCTPKPHKLDPQNVCISDGSLANLKKWIDSGASK